MTSYSMTSVISLPPNLGWPRQRGTLAVPVLSSWSCIGVQGQQVQNKEIEPVPAGGITQVLQNSFLETSRLGPCHILIYLCSSGNPCTLFGLCRNSEVSPSLVTPSTPNPLGYCSNLCRKECTASLVYSIEGEISTNSRDHMENNGLGGQLDRMKKAPAMQSCCGSETPQALSMSQSYQHCSHHAISTWPGLRPRASKASKLGPFCAYSPPTSTLQLWKKQIHSWDGVPLGLTFKGHTP